MQQRDKRKDADTTRLREVVTVEKENNGKGVGKCKECVYPLRGLI